MGLAALTFVAGVYDLILVAARLMMPLECNGIAFLYLKSLANGSRVGIACNSGGSQILNGLEGQGK